MIAKKGTNHMKKILTITVATFLFITMLCGCTQAQRVNANISKEADNFNVTRRIEVINMRTDKPIIELVGRMSISNNTTNELVVTVETDQNVYKKHYIYLNAWTMYVLEDVSGAYVDKYHYEVNFLPEMIMPVSFTAND